MKLRGPVKTARACTTKGCDGRGLYLVAPSARPWAPRRVCRKCRDERVAAHGWEAVR